MFKGEYLHDFIEVVPGDNFEIDDVIVDEFLFECESWGVFESVVIRVEGSDVLYDFISGESFLGQVA